jgi:hypothetical protein
MVQISVLFALPLLALTMALPSGSTIKAGGPSLVPIPASCPVPSVLPNQLSSSGSFKPTAKFQNSALLYQYGLPESSTSNSTSEFTTCKEQCYGFGNPGQCKGVYFAHYAPYASRGGPAVGTVCLLWNTPICPSDLEYVRSNITYGGAHAVNIECQRSG